MTSTQTLFLSIFALGCGFQGSKSDLEGFGADDAGAGDPSENGGVELEISSPAANTDIIGDSVVVTGVAKQLEDVRVNGQPITVDGAGQFSVTLSDMVGVEAIVLTGVDDDGETVSERLAVRVSEYWVERQIIDKGLMFSMDNEGLGMVADWAAQQLDPETLTEMVMESNPVFSAAEGLLGSVVVNIDAITFSTAAALVRTTDSHLFAEYTLHDLVVTGQVDVGVLGMGDTIAITLTAAGSSVSGDIDLGIDDGKIALSVSNTAITVAAFDLQTDGFQDILESNRFKDALLAEVGPVMSAEVFDMVLPLIEGHINGLTNLGVHEMMGAEIDIQPVVSGFEVSDHGLSFEFDVSVDAGLNLGGDIFQQPNTASLDAQGQAFGILVSDNLINILLHSLWVQGAFDTRFSTEDDTLTVLANNLFESTETSASTTLAMPPVVVQEDGVAVISIGGLVVALETPDGELGDIAHFVIDGSANLGLGIGDCEILLGMGDVVANPVALETDWGLSNPEAAAELNARLPGAVIGALLSGMTVPLPDLRVVGASEGEVSRSEDGLSTLILVD